MAFLKAMDFSRAAGTPDPATVLKAMLDSYVYERDLLSRCGERRLSRVVKAVGHGAAAVEPGVDGLVQYLIFELADGDVRTYMNLQADLDLAWSLRTLHEVAIGVRQLHWHGVAHLDLKPSNVFTFAEEGSKVGDLGSALEMGTISPNEAKEHPGDYRYAPPEILYRHQPPDWSRRRFGCDLYLLGSMITFLMTGVSAAAALQGYLDPRHRWGTWRGSWDDVLPFLQEAFGKVLDDFSAAVHPAARNELREMVAYLCEPDPTKRGHPKNLSMKGNELGTERFVSGLNLLASRAEAGALK